MAANYVTVTPALAELISSLPQDEVPFKLRCAICSKLAVNAFKTPCCEQMLCENCTSTLPTTCPVCEHTPVSVDDCKPNNKLRMTTRAFLKTAEKKRDTLQTKEATPATPITPVDAKPSATPALVPAAQDQEVAPVPVAATAQEEQQAPAPDPSADQDAAPDKVEDSTGPPPATEGENISADDQVAEALNGQEPQADANGEMAEATGDPEAAVVEATEGGEDTPDDGQQKPGFPTGFGFNGMNGQLPNMAFAGGDFNQMNQMQMMMAMQNGMGPNGFNFPMMGMPGMDPSMMNNMFQMNNGFGAPGMDMSMMNGGMGGFNGGVGSGENWNGPQSWNNGQNNFNHPNASGMGNGDYGHFNSGYHTGYNQGNFGPQNNQYNDFRGGRGYFRGRGARGGRFNNNFGRGGYGYGQQGNYQGQNQNYMNQQHQQYGSNLMGQSFNGVQAGASQNGLDAAPGDVEGDKNVDEYGRALRPDITQEESQDAGKTEGTESANGAGEKVEETNGPSNADDSSAPQPISVIETVQLDPDGDTIDGNVVSLSMRPNGPLYNNHQRGGSFGGMPPPAAPAPDVPLNAPKGPKAMRQGLPNTSLLHLRAKGYSIPGDESLSINTNRVQSPSIQSGHGSLNTPQDDDHERERRRSRSNSLASTVKRRGDGERERSSSRSRTGRDRSDRHRDRERRGTETRSTSRSRSRSREHRDRKRKHRTDEDAEERDYDKDKERRHRHRSSKKYYDDEEPRSSTRDDKYADRSRSASPGSRKSSRREKRRDRDRDEDEDRDHKHKSSHSSSHRHRDSRTDREREREGKDRDRKRDRERDRDRGDRDREREKDRDRRRSKHSTAEPAVPTEPSADKSSEVVKDFNPPTGPRGSISKNYSIFNAPRPTTNVKGTATSTSRPSSSASASIPKGPRSAALPKDPHAAEREARNRERLLKETQRLAGLGGGGLKRRSGADEGGDGSGRGSRKKRRGGEVLDDEDTLKRAEAEREGTRWG